MPRPGTATGRRALLRGAAMLLLAASPIARAQPPAELPPDIDPSSRARLPYLARDAMDAGGQALFDSLPFRTPDGRFSGPLAFAAYTPGVAKALLDLHNAAVAGTLSTAVRELAILVASRETNYDVGWSTHEEAAVKAGVDPRVIDVVRHNGALDGVPPDDAVVIRFGRQLLTEKSIDSGTFADAVELVGERGAMDLVAVMVTYAASGYYAIAVDEQPRGGRAALPPTRTNTP